MELLCYIGETLHICGVLAMQRSEVISQGKKVFLRVPEATGSRYT